MKSTAVLLCLVAIVACTRAKDFHYHVAELDDQLIEARALIARLLPTRHSSFNVSLIEPENKMDVFEVESVANNTIELRGSSGVMIAAALNWYLKYKCMSQFSWGGDHIEIPSKLPTVTPAVRVPWAAKYRYYFNTCTFGYSTAWWNWTRWEREIDYMALNGINLPLAFTGQEYIFSEVYTSLGLTKSILDSELFTGPAFLPWNRMGNVNSWGGPLPSTWINDQFELQKTILNRQRGLGMTPILPSFAGHVPPSLKHIFPKADITHLVPWGGFTNGTYFLDPNDSLFQTIATKFLELQTSLIGTDHFYNADPFNEETPPSNATAYLASLAKAYFSSMQVPDPKAVWVMQGWFLYYGHSFWGTAQTKALLTSIPIGSLIMLDLFAEHVPVWSYTNSFYGHDFIWCYLGNFGGRSGMFGEIENIASGPLLARTRNPNNVGTGITPEAIAHNFITFELALEMAWRNSTVDLTNWVQGYVNRRYGVSDNHPISKAWVDMTYTVFNCNVTNRGGTRPSYIVTYPSLELTENLYYDPVVVERAWSAMLNGSQSLSGVDTYRYDLAEITRQVLSNMFLDKSLKAINAYRTKDVASFDALASGLLTLINDTDKILGTRQEWLVGNWINDAKQLGTTADDRLLLEMNARYQITNWGPSHDVTLRDYASKLWAGLVKDYYYTRWSVFLSDLGRSLQSKQPFDNNQYDAKMVSFLAEYTNRTDKYPIQTEGDSVTISTQLFKKYLL